jgi:ferredoxin
MQQRPGAMGDGPDGSDGPDKGERPSEQPRGRHLETAGIRELLLDNLEHPRWQTVAERCLSCANCTMVCPTCFCSSVEEVSDLTGDHVVRERSWASCFTAEHSYMNTGAVRKSTASQYRQWLTHKLATWHDQFETSGCVGCGRCITWCPVGIDLTEEVAAIRADQK